MFNFAKILLNNMRTLFTATILVISIAFSAHAQNNGIIQGNVVDAINNEPLPFAAVLIQGTEIGTTTDIDGRYELNGLKPGLYNLSVSFIGYKTKMVFEVEVKNSKPAEIDFAMEQESMQLDEVVVSVQNKFEKNVESPVSLKKLGINEIQRNPGGNMDISRVIQSLPGVASTVSFRNDLIVRGGGPNENRFYLDGIEIPAINHFATQGSSGGPVGMINVNFIREVDFYTGAFPANRGNTMSSLMEINLKDGRTDRVGGIFQVGASEVGLTLEGPIGEKATFLASARRSYLQFLFKVLELPFLPTYNDFQFKVKYNIDRKNQITFLGLGAIDNFSLNMDANETPEQQYILNYLPVNEQWNYSIGAKYTNYREKSLTNIILSRFMLNNTANKYKNNNENDEALLDYQSQEIENKLRIENIFKDKDWTYTAGFGIEEAKYNTTTIDKRIPNGFELNYASDLRLVKWSVFGHASKTLFNRLDVSLGLRADANNFNSSMSNPLNQLSPRLSLSYNLTDALSINANWGIYYQLPPYTTMGYRNTQELLVNTDLTFIQSQHFVAGMAYLFDFNARFSVEGFYKIYDNYPLLLPDSISLANLGGDFGVIGNRPALSINKGRSYGMELTYEQKLFKGFFGIAAVTLVRSEFQDKNEVYVPSSWDNRMIVTLTFGKKFGNNWQIGGQYQFLGGAPYTPYDVAATADKTNWDNIGFGIPDYNLLNTQRVNGFNRLNLRIDKKWYFDRYSLNLYFDIQNALGQVVQGQPFIDVVRDDQGNPVEDPNDPTKYQVTQLTNESGTVLPSIGLLFEF